MRIAMLFLTLLLSGFSLNMALQGQSNDGGVAELRDAKARALKAERRAEALRQEAASADMAAERLVAQRAALSAEMEAASARISAARTRMAIVAGEQRKQAALLGKANQPLLNLNALLQKLTRQPAALMLVQTRDRRDYIHLRATMSAIAPVIERRTAGLRQKMALQGELRAQEAVAIKSLHDARGALSERRAVLAELEHDNRGQAESLTADAAVEYELAIGQGERARDLVEQMDANRESDQNAAELAVYDGPRPRQSESNFLPAGKAYMLPAKGRVVSGFGELNPTGYRERGLRLAVAPSAPLVAPAAGTVNFAGQYRSFGNIVIIDHGGGWSTLVTNLAELGTQKGAKIAQGAPIGKAAPADSEIMVELRRHGRTFDIAALLY
ncbi:MAG: peptidoglycan DD-metalloendopeptidase family protein [Sphingomonadales bacterium]|jgi:septal ring factor EnvC (AmiA/AmiB activator)|nr:peptidoglycan DD-metalloendopeptidase family protein [Sphingomonadales bacterium]MBK9431217.1 peptidoglycan DD-metalloendopeptidase family protein [Sphingomonadales bacterium]MBL0021349.1 peptidoglycan DD-metalloendopeptidase family protein [Sphingomonadales bacterium]